MYELALSKRKQFHQKETRDQEIEEDDSSTEMRSNSTFFGTLDSFNGPGIYDVFIQPLNNFTLLEIVHFDRKLSSFIQSVQCFKTSHTHDLIFTKQKFQITIVRERLHRFLIFQLWVKI